MTLTQWIDSLDPRVFWPAFVVLWLIAVRALFAFLASYPPRIERGPFADCARNQRGRRRMATDLEGPVRRHNSSSAS